MWHVFMGSTVNIWNWVGYHFYRSKAVFGIATSIHFGPNQGWAIIIVVKACLIILVTRELRFTVDICKIWFDNCEYSHVNGQSYITQWWTTDLIIWKISPQGPKKTHTCLWENEWFCKTYSIVYELSGHQIVIKIANQNPLLNNHVCCILSNWFI